MRKTLTDLPEGIKWYIHIYTMSVCNEKLASYMC